MYAMLFGPWFTTRSPIPSALTDSTSKWIGLESLSSAATVFIRSAETASIASGGTSVPTCTSWAISPASGR